MYWLRSIHTHVGFPALGKCSFLHKHGVQAAKNVISYISDESHEETTPGDLCKRQAHLLRLNKQQGIPNSDFGK
jgi:hypothetical protein